MVILLIGRVRKNDGGRFIVEVTIQRIKSTTIHPVNGHCLVVEVRGWNRAIEPRLQVDGKPIQGARVHNSRQRRGDIAEVESSAEGECDDALHELILCNIRVLAVSELGVVVACRCVGRPLSEAQSENQECDKKRQHRRTVQFNNVL